MNNVIGLSKARKKRAQTKRKEQAELNSVKFGRTKAQKKMEEATVSRADKMLDAHKTKEE